MAEIDREIALFQRADRERIQEERLQEKREAWDIKKKLTYSVETLINGIKSGKQYLYALKLEFETRTIFNERFSLPFIKDFFDDMKETSDEVFFVSNKRNVTLMIRSVTCQGTKEGENWPEETLEKLDLLGLHVRKSHSRIVEQMEYVCYEIPTSAGDSYNVSFWIKKGQQVYIGAMNCLSKDKDGMGLLLEALILVMEEMNR